MKNKKPIFPSLVTLESGLEIMKGGYKMKQSRRVLAVLIALVMVITMIPQNALAVKNKAKKKKYTVEISYVYSNGKKAAKTVKKSYPAGKKKVKATVKTPKIKGYTATMTKKQTKIAKKAFTKFQFNGKKIKYQLNQAKKNIKIQVVYVKNKTEKTTKKKEETKPADSDKDDAGEGTTSVTDDTTVATTAEGFMVSGSFAETLGDTSVDVIVPEGAFDVPVKLELGKASSADEQKVRDQINGNIVDMALVDISFLDEDGNEIEPDKKIEVSIETSSLKEAENYTLYHLNNEGVLEEVTPPELEEVSNDTAAFSSDQFSVYAIVGRGNENGQGREHSIFAYTVDGNGEDINEGSPNEVVIKTNTNNDGDWVNVSSLAKSIEGYTYKQAHANSLDGTIITTGQIRVSNNQFYYRNGGNGNGTQLTSIYFVYEADVDPDLPPGPGPDDPPAIDPPSPTTVKTVTDNVDENGHKDNTYTITLDITGKAVDQEIKTGANVLILFDYTSSMGRNMKSDDPNSGQRLAAAKAAVAALVNALNPGTGENQNDIDFAIVPFARTAQKSFSGQWIRSKQDTATSKAGDRVKAEINDLSLATSSGTNWVAGLRAATEMLASRPDNDPTYVVFLTDGEPSFYNFLNSSGEQTNSGKESWSNPDDRVNGRITENFEGYKRAIPYATYLAAHSKLYGVFCGDEYDELLQSLITTAQGEDCITATDSDGIREAFKNIAQTIVNHLAATEVETFDGVTTLSSVSAATVQGEVTGFKYYIKRPGDTQRSEWAEAPDASYDPDTGVTWDLGDMALEDEAVYTVEFEVWPSQDAYDLTADINNGIIRNADGTIKEIGSPADAYSALPQSVKDQYYESGGYYYMRTNTTLTTTYEFNGQTYSGDVTFAQGSMDLDTRTIDMRKLWPQNMLDQYGEADYYTGSGVAQADEITLMVTRDEQEYMPVTITKVGPDGQAGTSDDWTYNDMYISCGLMTVKNGIAEIKEYGHDYTVLEPSSFSYYWDLYADVCHPMVINGVTTMLVLDNTVTSADNVNTFKIKDKYYKKKENSDVTLEASNFRRSNLNLTKEVSTEGGLNDYFTYEATVEDAFSTDGKVWFSAWDSEVGSIVKSTDWVISGATAQEGNTGYWYAENGATVQFKIKKGWNVRYLNLLHGSTFSFEEIDMPQCYIFEDVTAELNQMWIPDTSTEDPDDGRYEDDSFMDPACADWYTVDPDNPALISGTVTEPNHSFQVTYTNRYEAFYVYHSGVDGDGNLEVIPMPASGKYDLTQNVTEGTLYGGYYLDYAGKGDYKDDGVKGTTGVKYDGGNYTWSNPETKNGMDITPVAGETYYIKEVPSEYLRVSHFETFNSYEVWNNSNLDELYMLTAVDDENYKAVGFDDYKDASGRLDADLYKFVTIKYPGYQTPDDDVTRIDLKDIAGMNTDYYKDKQSPTYGYIAMAQKTFTTKDAFDMRAYFVTPDSIKVSGYRIKCFEIEDSNPKDGYITATIGHVKFGLAEEFKTKLYVMPRKLEYLPDSSAYKKWAEIKHKDEE